jgi:nucleoside-diphosphate-sugar epimerase
VTEEWPINGIPSSAYSRQKVAAEWQLDAFARAHREVTVSRVRPTVIAQPVAAREIATLFLGRPVVLDVGRRAASVLGLVPMPRGLRMQLVHADDVAAALVAILTRGATGAFNLAAEPLDTTELAAVIGARPVLLPPRVARTAVRASFAARLSPLSAGWFDLAMQIPLLDTGRAQRDLDWRPRHGSAATAAELLGALGARQNASPALRGGPDQVKAGAT